MEMDEILRRVLRPHEVERARENHRRTAEEEALHLRGDPSRAAAHLRLHAARDGIVLGKARDGAGRPYWASVAARDLLRRHLAVTGSTGSGKSRWVAGLLFQLLRLVPEVALVLLDFKGETAEWMRGDLVPAVLARGGSPVLVDQLRILRIGDPELIPCLRITEPEAGVSREVQAHALAATVEDVAGEALRHRMNRICLKLGLLCLELREPLPRILAWLENPTSLRQAARRSADPELRRYLLTVFEEESAESRLALAARLDGLLMVPEIRLALSAPTCAPVPEMLDRGVTVIDCGPRPGVPERASRLLGRLLLGRLTRAILSRQVTDESRPVVFALDEYQEGLGRGDIGELTRLLALSRSRLASLWLVTQAPSIASDLDPALPRAITTNCSLRAIFRANATDAGALEFALPSLLEAGRRTRQRERLISEVTHLPQREFLLHLADEDFGLVRLRSPRVDLDRLHRLGEALPPDVRERVRRGTVSLTRAEIERALETAAEIRSDSSEDVGDLLRPAGPTDDRFPSLG
jgi:hypothetical protein